jgi:hypothetical protein
MKIKQLFTGFLIFTALSIQCISAQNSLIMKFTDGTEKASLITSIRKITLLGSNLILNNMDATTSPYAISGIRKMVFGLYSGVNEIISDKTSLGLYPCPANTYLSLQNAPAGNISIRIFSLNGVEMMNINLVSGSQQIDISKLAQGMYLLKANNKTLKFTKL